MKLFAGPDGVRWLCFELAKPRIMELPRNDGEGAPAGVNEWLEEGGGPAGVVDGSVPKLNLPLPRGFSGVEKSDGRPKEENGLDMADMRARVWLGLFRRAWSGGLGADVTRLKRHEKGRDGSGSAGGRKSSVTDWNYIQEIAPIQKETGVRLTGCCDVLSGRDARPIDPFQPR